MQKITLIGRPNALPQLRPGSVFAIPRRGGPTFGMRVAGADTDATIAWACLADADPARAFTLVHEPRADAPLVFAFPSAGTVVDPQSLLPADETSVPGLMAMAATHLLMRLRGAEAGLVDLESGALVERVAGPFVYASRWQVVVLGHGDQASPVVSVAVTPQ